jgi:hypothetical protein
VVKLFETEEEAKKEQEKFFEQMQTGLEEETKKFTSLEINWIPEKENYKEVKRLNLDCFSYSDRLFLLAHSKDIIKGKPQLIQGTIQRIPMLRKVEKYKEDKKGHIERLIQYKFIDDRYDKRYDGNETGVLAFDFWVYRVIDNGKEYYIFSDKKLNEVYSDFYGMKINLDDLSEITNTLKVKKIASIFILKEVKPNIKILSKEELIEHCKEVQWNRESFLDFLFLHSNGNIYDYTEDFNNLRVAQLLSGKYEGYPLHLLKMGAVGTGKTTEAEVLDFKFQEDTGILEAGSSRMKVLVPSFKEKPANLGYICNCNRIAIIDELMKMITAVINSEHIDPNNYFGGLNMLLEHKRRMVGSGNDNSAMVQATAKICVTTNPLDKKDTISAHLNAVDPTTLSRFLIWVQDKEESEKIYNKDEIRRFSFSKNPSLPPLNPLFIKKTTETISQKEESDEKVEEIDKIVRNNLIPDNTVCIPTNNNNNNSIKSCDCIIGNLRNSFLTIYDSCQEFLVDFDMEKIKEIFRTSVSLANEPMKQIWKARGIHHLVLIFDGIVKFRCLFRDFDPLFSPKEEDYVLLEKIIKHLINTWKTNFNQDSWKGFLDGKNNYL